MNKKLKPFDLKAALNGEPVMLRDGRKAYVRHYETELDVPANDKMLGYIAGWGQIAWKEKGVYGGEGSHYLDIIGMYPKARIINGFEVPAPETEAPAEGSIYCIPMLTYKLLYERVEWDADSTIHSRLLERGLVFLTQEDAVANAKAMLGIDPNNQSID